MSSRNGWWAAVIVAVCSLQAWDSGVLRAPGLIQSLVACAIVLPAVALVLTKNYGLQASTVASSFILLTFARMLSPSPLPTLHIIAFIPAVLIFFTKTEGATMRS
jgi:hypothetical protein